MITYFSPKLTPDKEPELVITLSIAYTTEVRSGIYRYDCPRDILDDIGAKELAKRIYSVFKQNISRPPAE